jgi:hypothetical protein
MVETSVGQVPQFGRLEPHVPIQVRKNPLSLLAMVSKICLGKIVFMCGTKVEVHIYGFEKIPIRINTSLHVYDFNLSDLWCIHT